MTIVEFDIPGVYELFSEPFVDERGFMRRAYDRAFFREHGLNTDWEQASFSFTAKKNTVRGIHVSLPPAVEGKLVSAVTGEALWIAIDLRRNSRTFGQWVSVTMSGDRQNALYACPGFAHGCVSITDNCGLWLMADQAHADAQATGIQWDDPELAIDWGLGNAEPILSERHQANPTFRQFVEQYGGL